MAERNPDLAWVRRELGNLSRELSKAINQWEPPSTRDVMRDVARVVRVLEELYPEPDWDEEPPHA